MISDANKNDSKVPKVLEVGDHLNDGTVCIAVNQETNQALFAPARIFGGKSRYDDQQDIPAQLNQSLNNNRNHGYHDWRNITDEEGIMLSQVWDKVAPDELKGSAAPAFRVASLTYANVNYGCMRQGGEAQWARPGHKDDWLPVPIVRSGPARS